MNTLEKIGAQRIPTTTPAAAIQHMRDFGWFEKSGDDYKFHIVQLSGADAQSDDERELNYTFRYLVTSAIESPGLTGKPLVEQATSKAKTFIANHQYVFAQPEEDATPKLDACGKPKPKKGAKKEMARKVYDEQIRDKGLTRKEAIAIIAEDVGMSPGGASTYYANLKKGTM